MIRNTVQIYKYQNMEGSHHYVYCTLTEVFLTLTEVFPCFFLSCKANARVKLAKTGHMKVVRLSDVRIRPPLPPGSIPGTHLC
jgi:hypothetical protein